MVLLVDTNAICCGILQASDAEDRRWELQIKTAIRAKVRRDRMIKLLDAPLMLDMVPRYSESARPSCKIDVQDTDKHYHERAPTEARCLHGFRR